MSTEILYQKVNGVLVPYYVHRFCPDGADGLVGTDARILALPYMDVDGVEYPYWSPDTCGSKYTDDFPTSPTSPQPPEGFAGQYLSYYLADFNLVAGNSIGTWSDRSTNNNNLTQTTSANQPLLIEDTQNQFNNVVRADATNDVMVGLPAHNSLVFKKGVPNLNAPSAPQIYALSAMNTTGAGSVYTSDGSFSLTALKASGMSFSMFIDTDTATPLGYLANFRGDSTSSIPHELALKAQNGNQLALEGYNGSSFITLQTATLVNDLGLAHVGFTMSAGGSSVKLYVNGSEIGTTNYSSLQTDTASALAISEGQQGNLYYPTDGLRAMPRVQNREITASEMAYLAQNPTTCYADLDNASGLKDATIYAPTLGEYNGSTNQALVDPASGITTIEAGTVAYTGTGLNVECTSIDIDRVLFSSSTTSAQVRISADNVYEVVSDGGTVYAFNAIKSGSAQEVNIINRVGDNLELFDAVGYKETLDVTGETFTIDRALGSASDADWKEIWSYPNALDETGRNYFYYLRNDQNEILLPPLLPDPNQNQEFIFTVKTDNAPGVSNNDQMKIGTIATGVYDCTVDWGDGSSDVITTWDDPAWTHTYSVAGTYVITISGTSFTYPYFYLGDDIKVLNVSKWGFTDYGTTALNSFRGCSNLTLSASDIPDTNSCTSLLDSWQKCSSLTSFPLINTSSVTLMSNTWYACSSLTSFPLINTSSVTAMQTTWAFCSSLTSFPLINTSSVNSMSSAWFGCSSLTDFPLIDVSSCTNFTDTWKGCALNSASIDNIMQALVNGNQNNLSTDISGGTNLGFASWSAGAVANYNTLISRGWTITTNP